MSDSSYILKYFSNHRSKWSEFYKSERDLIKKVWSKKSPSVLDIGCGCAGLYSALKERFGNLYYSGVEIDTIASDYTTLKYPEIKIYNTDFYNFSLNKKVFFDKVISLSCLDWNTNINNDDKKFFHNMLFKAWDLVNENGHLIISLRLDKKDTLIDINESYQYIDPNDISKKNIANYSIISINDCLKLFKKLNPSSIIASGYYGKPSKTAVTPKSKVCFVVFALEKTFTDFNEIKLDIDLPEYFKNKLKRIKYRF